jgi:hypothetical protein
MKCIICDKEFESKRSTAKYCSGACRIKSMRGVSVTNNVSVTPISVTLEAVT